MFSYCDLYGGPGPFIFGHMGLKVMGIGSLWVLSCCEWSYGFVPFNHRFQVGPFVLAYFVSCFNSPQYAGFCSFGLGSHFLKQLVRGLRNL